MKVTRDVVSDLWPVYEAGEASADTRALVEAFLAGDPAFAEALRGAASVKLPALEVPMSASAETQALKRTRDLVRGHGWLRGVKLCALVFTVFAITRVFTDTTWTPSPKMFIADTIGATICWTIYGAGIVHVRRKALRA
jgi:hypothetical protein